jgi:hypothetical protein
VVSKTVLFGFDMEVFAVGVPYAYEPSRFSPFLKEILCLVYTDGNLRIEILRRPIVFTVLSSTLGERAKSKCLHFILQRDQIR